MNRDERKQRQREVAEEMKHAIAAAAKDGAIGFQLVWLTPSGDYGDAFDCDDVLVMTSAVNDSALKARIDHNRGNHLATAN